MMMNKMLLRLVMVIAICSALLGCTEENGSNSDQDTARVQLKLVDAPGDYLEVNIEIIAIQYTNSVDDEGWKSFTPEVGYPINVDLTELVAGNSLLLADEVIEEGTLSQIRLVLSDNNTLLIEGESDNIEKHLKTPSAQQSGLKLKLNESLEGGFSYTFILDWDVQKSIVEAGNSGNYILKPVIRTIVEVNSGSIQGTVVGKESASSVEASPLNNVTVLAFDVNDLVNSIASTSTNEDGEFLFQGLSESSYILRIEQNGYDDYETPLNEAISVTVGNITVLENSIELLLNESIVGKVVDELNVAISSVVVEIFDKDDPNTQIITVETNEEGTFVFRGLSEGTYIFKITHAGYQDYQTEEGSEIEVIPDEVNVLENDIVLLAE